MDSYVRLTKWWCVVTWKFKISSLARPMGMKLDGLMTYGEAKVPIKSRVLLTTWLQKVTWQTKKENISSSRRLMATKLWRVLTYGEAKTIMKLYESDHVITRGHVSNGKLNISSSTRPIPPHLAGWWGMTLWPCSLERSHKKFKTKI